MIFPSLSSPVGARLRAITQEGEKHRPPAGSCGLLVSCKETQP